MKTQDMTTGSPMRNILIFALPLLLGNIFQQLYNVVDSTIVGRLIGADALAAVGAPGNVLMLIMCLCFGLTNGTGVIIAQCVGARNFTQLKSVLGTFVFIIGILSGIIMVLGTAIAYPILRAINVPDSIIKDAALYMRVLILATPFTMMYNACSAIMRNMGNSKTPLLVLILSSVLNAVLDIVFVAGLHWGVFGTALATALSTAISAFVCFLFLYRNRFDLHIDGIRIHYTKDNAHMIIKTGTPVAMQSCMISLGTLSVNSLINSFGTQTMAAYVASTKIDSVAIMVIISMGMSLSVYTGQNVGAGNIKNINTALIKTLSLVLSYCLVITLILLFFGDKILSLFLDPKKAPESIAIGTQYLKIIGSAYFMAGIMRCYLNIIHGAGDINVSMLTGIIELSVRIIASYALVRPLGVTGLWIAIPISWGSGSLVPLIRYYSGKWKEKTLVTAQI